MSNYIDPPEDHSSRYEYSTNSFYPSDPQDIQEISDLFSKIIQRNIDKQRKMATIDVTNLDTSKLTFKSSFGKVPNLTEDTVTTIDPKTKKEKVTDLPNNRFATLTNNKRSLEISISGKVDTPVDVYDGDGYTKTSFKLRPNGASRARLAELELLLQDEEYDTISDTLVDELGFDSIDAFRSAVRGYFDMGAHMDDE